ncbi:helix-turn-helix domain-containing protein [Alloscardovia theropitheci]|uniref:Helix-turn-helix domain-containing protein n=1 Tax=Alloscardovia theropitheci TaxID=2496842 RepID=A0A4R0QNK7_9BIFI|nr:helix-turn-helix domain-containing protein [Alloscardovia theropitheci]TCD53754.1 helix-turn-helix domain-containing protein [Alloscardovia theropitheci]
MSLKATTWALYDAPKDIDATEFRILMIIADNCDENGKGFYYSMSKLAQFTGVSVRSAQRHLQVLKDRGLIVDGDQRIVAYLPANKRPRVYNLNMTTNSSERPYSGMGSSSMPVEPVLEAAEVDEWSDSEFDELVEASESSEVDTESTSHAGNESDNSSSESNICSNGGDNLTPQDIFLDSSRGDTGVSLGCHRGDSMLSPKPYKPIKPIKPREGARAKNENSKLDSTSVANSSRPVRRSSATSVLESDYDPASDSEAIQLAYLAGVELATAFAAFKDYYTASGKRFSDWGAKFRLWLRREKTYTTPATATHLPVAHASSPSRLVSTNNRNYHTTSGVFADSTRKLLSAPEFGLSMSQKEQLFAQALNIMINTSDVAKVREFIVEKIS